MKNTLLLVFACGLILSACTKESNCLRGHKASVLSLPLASSSSIDYSAHVVSNEAHDCLVGVLGKDVLKTPNTFDVKYRSILSFHKEDTTLIYSTIPHTNTYLFRIDSTERYSFFLLHEETGAEMEGDHYDILLTVNPSGKLIDNVIVGAFGIQYQREFSITGPSQFEINETTGRDDTAGPWYKGVYRVEQDGKFALTGSETGDGNVDGESAAGMEYSSSIVTVSGSEPLLQAIEESVFSESLSKEYLEEKTFESEKVYIAVGQSGIADFVLTLMKNPQVAGGTVNLYTESWMIAAPVVSGEIAGGKFLKTVWTKTSDGSYSLAVTIQYEILAEGGTNSVQKEYVFSYSKDGLKYKP